MQAHASTLCYHRQHLLSDFRTFHLNGQHTGRGPTPQLSQHTGPLCTDFPHQGLIRAGLHPAEQPRLCNTESLCVGVLGEHVASGLTRYHPDTGPSSPSTYGPSEVSRVHRTWVDLLSARGMNSSGWKSLEGVTSPCLHCPPVNTFTARVPWIQGKY